jgi:hypothetical protein
VSSENEDSPTTSQDSATSDQGSESSDQASALEHEDAAKSDVFVAPLSRHYIPMHSNIHVMWQASSQQNEITLAQLRAQIATIREQKRVTVERYERIICVLTRIRSSLQDGSWLTNPARDEIVLEDLPEVPVSKKRKL